LVAAGLHAVEASMSEETVRSSPREVILSGAFDALMRHGLPMLSYDRIAEAAGLSRQVVRYHFPDPEDLMVGLCDKLAATYTDALITNAVTLEGPSRIEMFLDFYFDMLSDVPKPRDDAVYDALMSFAAGSPKVRAALRGQYSLLGQVLSHEFRVAYPALSREAAGELSFLFVSLMYGHWKMVASLGLSETHNEVTRQGMERLIRSYVVLGKPASSVGRVWTRPD